LYAIKDSYETLNLWTSFKRRVLLDKMADPDLQDLLDLVVPLVWWDSLVPKELM